MGDGVRPELDIFRQLPDFVRCERLTLCRQSGSLLFDLRESFGCREQLELLAVDPGLEEPNARSRRFPWRGR